MSWTGTWLMAFATLLSAYYFGVAAAGDGR
jgi:hypothetical protein